MINVSTIMKQVQEWLIADAALKGATITRSEFVNEDPNRAINGWIGIYRRSVDYDPRNLGIPPNNFEADLSFLVYAQKSFLASGEGTEDVLEEFVKSILDRVVQIPRTYLAHFSSVGVEYTYLEDERKTMYFQGALITFEAEVSFEVE